MHKTIVIIILKLTFSVSIILIEIVLLLKNVYHTIKVKNFLWQTNNSTFFTINLNQRQGHTMHEYLSFNKNYIFDWLLLVI